eukprot:GHVQ01005024.1.p1 GENE.GHVQ01005024.1~~GHVQ01005024.1.p1  ORF type:complete len:267 (+),score=11.03 GHVQ01005024.1:472-1272(+)
MQILTIVHDLLACRLHHGGTEPIRLRRCMQPDKPHCLTPSCTTTVQPIHMVPTQTVFQRTDGRYGAEGVVAACVSDVPSSRPEAAHSAGLACTTVDIQGGESVRCGREFSASTHLYSVLLFHSKMLIAATTMRELNSYLTIFAPYLRENCLPSACDMSLSEYLQLQLELCQLSGNPDSYLASLESCSTDTSFLVRSGSRTSIDSLKRPISADSVSLTPFTSCPSSVVPSRLPSAEQLERPETQQVLETTRKSSSGSSPATHCDGTI